MNARWQGYMEQREKYTRALEKRCAVLQKALNQQHHRHHHQHQQQQRQWLTDEQQRRVDEILLDQRQKTELTDEARLKVLTITFRFHELMLMLVLKIATQRHAHHPYYVATLLCKT